MVLAHRDYRHRKVGIEKSTSPLVVEVAALVWASENSVIERVKKRATSRLKLKNWCCSQAALNRLSNATLV